LRDGLGFALGIAVNAEISAPGEVLRVPAVAFLDGVAGGSVGSTSMQEIVFGVGEVAGGSVGSTSMQEIVSEVAGGASTGGAVLSVSAPDGSGLAGVRTTSTGRIRPT
jgi:hypothetical protein